MKRHLLIAIATALLTASLAAADSSPKDDVLAAAKKLGEKENYSWRSTVVVPEDAPFKPGPTEGKTEKAGYATLSMSVGENTLKAVLKDGKATATNPDGAWQTMSELENGEGMLPFLAMRLRTYKVPADQVADIVTGSVALKKDGDIYASDLTEDGAKKLLALRPSQGDGPTVSNAKGSVKFWLKDGTVTKYETKVKGTMNFNGNDFDQDRTTTVEIKEIGTTKVSVPDEAKKKLS